ncbi:hypothetical protein SDC9_115495 [bioreactor metagenome]|jgi:hypothetical protein|uniref:Uncharacterized protein n=1 Tax=bioreactor metagenome TaxID=1076179 RepID=A0A645BTJ8_9ZZZZ
MLVGGVVHHQIHDDPDPPFVGTVDQPLHIVHRAETAVDAPVVADVVSVVDLW